MDTVGVGREERVAVKPPFPFHREYDAYPFFFIAVTISSLSISIILFFEPL